MEASSFTHPKHSSRIELKMNLQGERRLAGRPGRCAVCGEALTDSMEMHEVLLTKGDVQGAPAPVKSLINSRFNCVLVHPLCHPKAQHEHQAFMRCIQQLILYNGYEQVAAWLSNMGAILKGGQVKELKKWEDERERNWKTRRLEYMTRIDASLVSEIRARLRPQAAPQAAPAPVQGPVPVELPQAVAMIAWYLKRHEGLTIYNDLSSKEIGEEVYKEAFNGTNRKPTSEEINALSASLRTALSRERKKNGNGNGNGHAPQSNGGYRSN